MEYFAHILVIAGLFVIQSVSLNFVLGFAGLPAMGQSAFFCVGAYASSLACLHLGLSPWFALGVAAALAWVVGWLVSNTAARLDGDFLALATFGLAAVTHSLAVNWEGLTRGPLGLSRIPSFAIFGHSLDTAWRFLPVVALFCLVTLFVTRWLVVSPFGRAVQGMRESGMLCESVGLDVGSLTRRAFAIGALFAGVAGALYAHYVTYIDPTSFTPMESVTILLMVVFGGMGSIPGSVLGAVILVALPELLRFVGLPASVAAPVRQILYGSALVVLMLARPSGILGRYRWR